MYQFRNQPDSTYNSYPEIESLQLKYLPSFASKLILLLAESIKFLTASVYFNSESYNKIEPILAGPE